jgi:hypothetical protein
MIPFERICYHINLKIAFLLYIQIVALVAKVVADNGGNVTHSKMVR